MLNGHMICIMRARHMNLFLFFPSALCRRSGSLETDIAGTRVMVRSVVSVVSREDEQWQ